MAIPQPQDPFGGWRQWQEENPDSPLSRIPLPRPGQPRAETIPFSPYSVGAPGVPQAVRRGLGEAKDKADEWMREGRMLPPAAAGIATDPSTNEGSRGRRVQETMFGLGDDVREMTGLNPNLVEEWRRRRLEPEPNLPPPTEPITAYPPEMAPSLPVNPYPDVGPTWDLRRETAQQYPLTDDSRQMLFDTGMSWYPYKHDPNTMGNARGRYHTPGSNRPEPHIEVLGELGGTAPTTLVHELAHKWWYEEMTPEERAAWTEDWLDHTDLAIRGKLATHYAGAEEAWPTEALSFNLQKSAEDVPPPVAETYAAGFYDAQKLAEQAEANLERQRLAWLSEEMGPQTLNQAYDDFAEGMFDYYFAPVSDPEGIRRRIWQRGIGGWTPGASG